MASTFDSLLRLELQATGENANTWGDKTNNNIELVADAIAGAVSISIAGSGDYTLTTANASTDQARKAFITLTGTLTGNRNIIVPSSSKIYFVRNNTSGAFTVTFKTASGTGALVPQGYVLAVACDGTDCFDASEVARVAKAGDTMTGPLVLPGNPTLALQAAPKQYVDAQVSVVAASVSTVAAQVSVVAADVSTLTLTVAAVSAQTSVNAAAITSVNAVVSANKAAAPLLAGANTFTAGNTFTSAVNIDGTLAFNSGYGSTAPAFGCRAWVNFIGSGTVSVRASGNISSVTDTNVGRYVVNFTSVMPDINYCVALGGDNITGVGNSILNTATPFEVDKISILLTDSSNNFRDDDTICVAVFR